MNVQIECVHNVRIMFVYRFARFDPRVFANRQREKKRALIEKIINAKEQKTINHLLRRGGLQRRQTMPATETKAMQSAPAASPQKNKVRFPDPDSSPDSSPIKPAPYPTAKPILAKPIVAPRSKQAAVQAYGVDPVIHYAQQPPVDAAALVEMATYETDVAMLESQQQANYRMQDMQHRELRRLRTESSLLKAALRPKSAMSAVFYQQQ
jgi:hypothetical protein